MNSATFHCQLLEKKKCVDSSVEFVKQHAKGSKQRDSILH